MAEFSLYEQGGFICPVCEHLILQLDSEKALMVDNNGMLDGVSACPHLIYALLIDTVDDNHFIYIQEEFAKRFIESLNENEDYIECLKKGDITDEEITIFINGNFKAPDRISSLFANFTETDIEKLLPPNVDLFYTTDHTYSYIWLAIKDNL